MERYLKKAPLKDLYKKILILTSPRQAEKTTLSKSLIDDFDYYNYDSQPVACKNGFLTAPTRSPLTDKEVKFTN